MENFSSNNKITINKIINNFKGERKYLSFVFFILLLIVLLGFISPFLVNNLEETWKTNLDEKIVSIKNEIAKRINDEELLLIEKHFQLKKKIQSDKNPVENSFQKQLSILNETGYSFQIFDNGKIISWNNNLIFNDENIHLEKLKLQEAFFYNSSLYSYLIYIDCINHNNKKYFLAAAKIFEKNFYLNNKQFIQTSFTNELENLFNSEFEIDYFPSKVKSKDGRKLSFEIFNRKKNQICLITFNKPTLSADINNLRDNISKVQAILIFTALTLLGISLRKKYIKINSRFLQYLLFLGYIFLFRWMLFKIGFPSNLLGEQFSNPSYFSSRFGEGIVKSPIEFFISVLSFFLIAINSIVLVKKYFAAKNIFSSKKYFYVLTPIIILIVLLLIRAFAASIKSVIFDSTLNFFDESEVMMDMPSLLMNFTSLILGFSLLLFIITLFYFIIGSDTASISKKTKLLVSLIITLAASIIFVLVQEESLITIPIICITTIFIFVVCYFFFISKNKILHNLIYTSIIASIVTIIFLIYFNSELEREKLKTTALELSRPTDNYLNFLINETLTNTASSNDLIRLLEKENSNYNAAAFILWSRSLLQNEAIKSSIVILDKNKKRLGSFSFEIENKILYPQIFDALEIKEVKVFDLTEKNNLSERIISGIIPVVYDFKLMGYVCVTLNYSVEYFLGSKSKKIFQAQKKFSEQKLKSTEYNIFIFNDNKLANVFGNLYPTQEQIKKVLNAKYKSLNEAWLNFYFNNENYIAYSLLNKLNGHQKIIVVTQKEKEFALSLFNFFKLFIIHSAFILMFFVFVLLYEFKKNKEFRYSFRTKLLVAFLFISVIPIVSLAIYNRQNVNEKSFELIKNSLTEKSSLVIKHIINQKRKHVNRSFLEAIENTSRELDLSFNVYKENNLIFTTEENLLKAGLLKPKLNPTVYEMLNNLGYKDYFDKEKIDDISFNSYYTKYQFDGQYYVFNLNDKFNLIPTTISTLEIDIFLFGIYSFAIVLIFIASTILANSISYPIRRLTKATQTIAQGDLNIKIDVNEKSELKELISGFNMMTDELKKAQSELTQIERETAWKEMAKQVAHEIKNPLTPMKLLLQQLIASYKEKGKNFDSLFEKVSNTILNQIDILNQIASEFSRFARMPLFNLERIETVKIISDTINLFIDEKNVKINFITSLQTCEIDADKSQFRRMLINFIRNSIQASATEINISLIEDLNSFYLVIFDNGKGIDIQYFDKIFDLNFTTKSSGMGLGLKLSKRFIESINGKISLVSSSENGTEFKIELPKISSQP